MGGSRRGNFGNTNGSRSFLDRLSDILTAASLIPGLDTIADLAAIPVDLLRKDWLSAGLGAIGAIPVIGEVADTAKITRKAEDAFSAIRKLDKVSDANKIDKIIQEIAPELAKKSPLKVPKSASVKPKYMNSYDQLIYTWKRGKYNYTSRWHTHTPNAPKYQGASWVVERKIPGIGHGKNARPPVHEVLVGKNKWISHDEWQKAITATKKGTATKKQREILDNGHWLDN